jgi:FkbM family methyltransferase
MRDDRHVVDRLRARVFHALQALFRRRGFDLQAYRIPPGDAGQLLALQGVDLVLDVGAAIGMYGRRIRDADYRGRICSFEPLSGPFRQLERTAASDPLWSCHRLAIGGKVGTAMINVAGNSDSSSLLPMNERHERSAPDSVYIGTEQVTMTTLDAVWDEMVGSAERPYLKLDVQGFELEALRGADRSLPKLHGIQAELSLVQLYEGAPLWTDVITYLQDRGFHVAQLAPAFSDPKTGEVLQVDGIFTRSQKSLWGNSRQAA